MKYYEVTFTIQPFSQDASDLLAALAGEAGFETFEETDNGLKGYVQQQLFDKQAIEAIANDFPLPDTVISFDVCQAEDRDWNEQWEQEGFDPIVVGNDAGDHTGSALCLVIHDGRHLPMEGTTGNNTPATDNVVQTISIEIDAKLAFGTGTHETTRMVCASLLDAFSRNKPAATCRLLDCGTGTGILSICALKLGAAEAVGYDIDEWSVDNARHNAVINSVDDRFTPMLGDASILNNVEGRFDIVVANINRNILMADMAAMHKKMKPEATLILSGFYTTDIPMLTAKADSIGLRLVRQREENGWACIELHS